MDFVLRAAPRAVEPGYLLGTVEILGVPHHLALIAVDEDGHAPYMHLEEMIDRLMEFDGAQEPYSTVEYHGTSYVCAITPYSK